MADTKILVLGFSVTAEQPGYVGSAKADLEARYGAEVVKVGLGGMQPYHARYLFPQIIAEHDPDILILDHATPAFRNFYNDRVGYRKSLLSILRECHERGIRTALIDLPRTDVDYGNDWVSDCHKDICDKLHVPYHRVALLDGMLRDEVHTTEYGAGFYAEVLKDLVARARLVKAGAEDFAGVPRFGAVPITDLVPDRPVHNINRGGYKAGMVTIAAGETLRVAFTAPLRVCGFTALMGPRTGTLEVEIGKSKRRQISYDQFCYYERVGAFVLDTETAAQTVTELSIRQSEDIPTVKLLKGTKDTGPRVGAVGHVFTETLGTAPPVQGVKEESSEQEEGARMKFLVFGFSVTGETPGYVEKCAEMCKSSRPDYAISKIGIGGLQPEHARHLVGNILRENKPDALILEFSTAAYRLQGTTDYRTGEQQATIQSVLRLCHEHKVKCGILDLPLTGVNPDDDWVSVVNETLGKRHHVPRVTRPLRQDLLWDNVHPTEAGKLVYAEALAELLDQVKDSTPSFRGITKSRRFSAFSIMDVAVKGGYMRQFSRHGYVAPMLAVPEGETITITLPKEVSVTAIITAIGPKSGLLVFQGGGENQALQCYDQHSYYERVGGRTFKRFKADQLVVRQSAMLPTVELLKGEKDTGPRVGGITHILYED